jgi:hypothetical protein
VKYPHINHINKLKKDMDAECSEGAYEARQRGEKILIEHVMPQRAFAQEIIKLVDGGASNEEILIYITKHYRLVLLTQEETSRLNRQNRSKITPDRLMDANIKIFCATTK